MTAGNWIALIVLALTLLGNLSALVWGASKMSSELRYLSNAIQELKGAFLKQGERQDRMEQGAATRDQQLRDHERRLGELERTGAG